MALKISVVIPNYNGKSILAKNLPHVIRNCQKCQIIIVDDASSDESESFLRKKFKKVKVIALRKNRGFARAVNIGFQKAKGDLVILLNSDVAPREKFLKAALRYFKDRGPSRTFAVGFADYSHENNIIITRGRGGGYFGKGFLNHFAAIPERGETLWVSGGSGIFDRRRFLELGGLDSLYAPFYWEDIDLSFRARQLGYKCFYEPDSKVDHYHEEGAIKRSHPKLYIKAVSYRNQFLFVWKNISDPAFLIEHMFWLPYHLTRATISFDLAFWVGFLWAMVKIPQLVFRNYQQVQNLRFTDREVLEGFEKS